MNEENVDTSLGAPTKTRDKNQKILQLMKKKKLKLLSHEERWNKRFGTFQDLPNFVDLKSQIQACNPFNEKKKNLPSPKTFNNLDADVHKKAQLEARMKELRDEEKKDDQKERIIMANCEEVSKLCKYMSSKMPKGTSNTPEDEEIFYRQLEMNLRQESKKEEEKKLIALDRLRKRAAFVPENEDIQKQLEVAWGDIEYNYAQRNEMMKQLAAFHENTNQLIRRLKKKHPLKKRKESQAQEGAPAMGQKVEGPPGHHQLEVIETVQHHMRRMSGPLQMNQQVRMKREVEKSLPTLYIPKNFVHTPGATTHEREDSSHPRKETMASTAVHFGKYSHARNLTLDVSNNLYTTPGHAIPPSPPINRSKVKTPSMAAHLGGLLTPQIGVKPQKTAFDGHVQSGFNNLVASIEMARSDYQKEVKTLNSKAFLATKNNFDKLERIVRNNSLPESLLFSPHARRTFDADRMKMMGVRLKAKPTTLKVALQ